MLVVNSLTKEPRISVIIPYYNLGKYLQDCIFSVLNQEYSNFEIIIVNDNSDCENLKILNKIANKNLKIFNLEGTFGELAAVIEGVRKAQGEFICLVNPADILLPNHLKALVAAYLESGFVCVFSQGKEIGQKDEVMSLNFKNNQICKQADRVFYKQIAAMYNKKVGSGYEVLDNRKFLSKAYKSISCALIKKEAFDIFKYCSDVEFWNAYAYGIIFPLMNLVGKTAEIFDITYLYRESDLNDFQRDIFNKHSKDSIRNLFINNRKKLMEKFGNWNYFKILYRIIF